MDTFRLSTGSGVDPDLAAALRQLLTKACTHDLVRGMVDGEATETPGLWDALTEGGWTTLEYPGDLGGAEATLADATTAVLELGASLADEQFMACAYVAGPVLASVMSKGATPVGEPPWFRTLATAAARAVLVSPLGAATRPTVEMHDVGGKFVLSGKATHVLGASADHHLLVRAVHRAGESFVVLPGSLPGVKISVEPALDVTRRLVSCVFDDVQLEPEAIVAAGPEAAELAGELQTRAALALAADSVGASRRVLELTVDYAGQREQFGRVIGSFQAVKHHCADMLVNVRMAASMLWESIDGRRDDLASTALLAKAVATQAFVEVAGTAIQVHGGIGFSWEHDLHLFLKRAMLNEMLLGPSSALFEAARTPAAV